MSTKTIEQLITDLEQAIAKYEEIKDDDRHIDDQGFRTEEADLALDDIGQAYGDSLATLVEYKLLLHDGDGYGMPNEWTQLNGLTLADDDEGYNAEICLELLRQIPDKSASAIDRTENYSR